MKKKKPAKSQRPKTLAEAMSDIRWGENNGRLRPQSGKDTYFAGTLPSPRAAEISLEDIKLLGEIFRGRQGLF